MLGSQPGSSRPKRMLRFNLETMLRLQKRDQLTRWDGCVKMIIMSVFITGSFDAKISCVHQ